MLNENECMFHIQTLMNIYTRNKPANAYC